MILNFGRYIYNDGVLGMGNRKPQVINATSSDKSGKASTIDQYKQYEFNESYYNQLLNNNQYQEALDYITRYKPTDPEALGKYEADVASLRQKARYDSNLKANMTDDQYQQYTFANGVFENGGLDGINDNKYINQFSNLKQLIGSTLKQDENGNTVIDKQATSLGLYFPSTKRAAFGWTSDYLFDKLKEDTTNGIDNFLETYNYTKGALEAAGISIDYKDTGEAYLRFDKSNEYANKILYNYAQFVRDNWGNDPEMEATIWGYDEDGNEISRGFIPMSYQFEGWRDSDYNVVWKGLNNLVTAVNNLDPDSRTTDYDYLTKDSLAMFLNMIDDAKEFANNFEEESQISSASHSSVEIPFISDDMQQYLDDAAAAGVEPKDEHLNLLKKQAVEIATKTMGIGDKRIYTSYFNKDDDRPNDETLELLEDDGKIKELFDMLSAAPASKIHLTTLISDGVIGTKITLDKQLGRRGSDDEDSESGVNDKVQIWIPGLFSEQAQNRLNSDPSSRAVLEANTLIDTNSTYTLSDGSEIAFVRDLNSDDLSEGKFIIRSGRITENGKKGFLREQEVTKEDVVGHITKDILVDQAITNQFSKHLSAEGNVMDLDAYDMDAKENAFAIANQLMYTGDNVYWLTNSKGEEIPYNRIFDNTLSKNEVSEQVYIKSELVREIYGRLMQDLYTYYDINDIALR